MKRFFAAVSVFAFLLGLSAVAEAAGTETTTINSTTFTDLGAAPVQVQTVDNPVTMIVSDSQPSVATAGGALYQGQPVIFPQADSLSHIWAAKLGGTAHINYTPVFSSGSGGGSVTLAAGAVNAGAYVAGSVLSGAFATGAITDLALAQGSTTSGEVGNLPLTATTTAAPTYTTAKSNPLSTDVAGNLRTILNAETTKVIGEVNQGTSPWVVSNGGTFAAQLTGTTNNINNIAGTVSLPTGASTSANQATEITSLATIATNSGLASTLATATTGGDTSFHVIAANSNNATSISSGAHTIYEVQVTNYGTNLGDLRIYDVSGAPTCSSATGVIRNWPTQSNATSPGFTYSFPLGIAITTGLSFCFTGAVADNDNTSFAGTNAAINIGYK